MKPILQVENISKSFGTVQALKDITLEIFDGETIALVGENGAGKSTLTKTITGVHRQDKGVIRFQGDTVNISSPKAAQKLGIEQVYQQSELAMDLTIAENIYLGNESFAKKGFIQWKLINQKAQALFDKYNIPLKPDMMPANLSGAMRQFASIAKVLARNPKMIIWDEPTAVLANSEVNILFDIIKRLKREHVTMIYISHRLEEVFALSERIAVMRDGQLIKVFENKGITKDDLIVHMLGRKLSAMYGEKGGVKSDDAVMKLHNVSTSKVHNISFELKKGEILGVAGLVNSGRTEMARAIYGVDKLLSGEIYIDGRKVNIKSPSDASKLGIFLAPEDRKKEAMVLCRSIRENVSLSKLKLISRYGICRNKRETEYVEKVCRDLSVKTDSIETNVENLSGGNQQKIVIAKAITAQPKILIFDEPTQGIDVGAKAEIYALLEELRRKGMSIIVISSEIEEVQGISDRLLIMRNGKITGELENEHIGDTERILKCMYRSEEDSHE